MIDPTEPEPISVCLLALPQSTPTALYGLYETLNSVGVIWPQITGEPAAGRRFEVRIVSPDGRPFTCANGAPIAPHASFAEVDNADIVIVTDLELRPDLDPRRAWPEAAKWMHGLYDAGAVLCSVCTGSILLAATGLLDNQEATTHWCASGLFSQFFPAVTLKPERILVPTGPEHRIITSGGSASWEDLALHLVARFSSHVEAVRTAKIFLFGDRSEGQLPYTVMGRGHRHDDARIAKAQRWAADHYAEDDCVARMMAETGLEERQFRRRFRATTGFAPLDYVQTLRIEEAKQMLETTNTTIDVIASEVGYEDVAAFRRLFKRRTGVTPARYRQRFGATFAM